MLLEEKERKRIAGTVINKFRGDVSILEPGLKMLEDRTDIPGSWCCAVFLSGSRRGRQPDGKIP